MKSSLVLFASIFVLTLSCTKKSTPTPPPPPSDVHLTAGLLVYLPFTGNMADSSGNGNLVTAVSGATLVSDENGKANGAFGGTGAGERLLVTNNGSIQFDTAFTISIDFLVNTLQQQQFLSMVDNTTSKGISFEFGLGTATPTNLDFGASDSLATCSTFGGSSNFYNNTSSFATQTGVWYNGIGIYHKGSLTMYINGKVASTSSAVGTIVPICSSAKFIVGGWWDSDPISINGKLDNVRLYNRVLNADEIDSLSKKFQ